MNVGRTSATPRRLALTFVAGMALGVGLAAWFQSPLQPESGSSPVPDSEVLAVVGDSTITVASFLAEVDMRGGAANFATPAGRRELLDDMIRVETLAAAARAAGYEGDPEFRRELIHLLAGKFRQTHLEPNLAQVDVTQAEIEEFYEEHRDRYLVPAATRLAALFFAYPEAVSDEARQPVVVRAREVREQALAAGSDGQFAVLASRYSDDQATRYRGGDLGWLTDAEIAENWGDDVAAAVANLEEPGEITEPVVSKAGVFLFRIVDSQLASWRPLSQVENMIRHELTARASQEIRDRFFESLAKEFRVEIDEERLAAVELPSIAIDRELRPPPVPQI